MKEKIWTAMLLLLTVPLVLMGGKLNWELGYEQNQISWGSYQGYDVLQSAEGRIFGEVGSPGLPSRVLQFSLPTGSELMSVEIVEGRWEAIGNYRILPVQQLVPLGQEPVFSGENPRIYDQDQNYPQHPLISFGTGNKSGYIIGWVEYSPYRYNPVSGRLEVMRGGQLVLNYEEGMSEQIYLSAQQAEVMSRGVEHLVENPQAVTANQPMIREDRNGDVEYVIVAPSGLMNSFDQLLSWKNQKGVKAEIISRDWITSNYSGYDDMEKIREFVKDYHQNHGLIYLIMAGDYDNLGARDVKIRAGNEIDFAPGDLYFSDVVPYSSDWDANNNHEYGELSGDGCDWYCDVYVGRFPINTTTEAARWINKLLTYEQNPPSGYLTRSLQGGAGLWPNVNYYGDRVCDSIADNHLPSWWTHTKMYENQGVYTGFPDSLELGYGWCHIAGHGNNDGIYWDIGGSLIHSSNNIQNGMKLGVLHSIACQPGWFDNYECCAEYYFNYINGGAIAIMFNARYGWGSPPNLGPSEWLDIWTAMEVFDNENWNIGIGHGLGKDHIIPGMGYTDHWCLCELNLFGDPEMQVYSRDPVNMSVTNQAVIDIGQGTMPVNVSSTRGPIEGAVCCLSRPGDSVEWFKAVTDASGNATISYNITDPSPIYLTVYAHDHLYYLDTLNIATSGSYVYFIGIDSVEGGFNNNQFNAGCDYDISVEVSNYGNQTSYGVRGILSSTDPNISIDDDTLYFGTINSNDTVSAQNFCGFTISNAVADNYYIPLELTCFDQNDSSWTSNLGITVNSPEMFLVSMGGPLQVLPGEDIYIWPKVYNAGQGHAYNLSATISCNDGYITIVDSVETKDEILSGDSSFMGKDSAFLLSISSNCPEPYWLDIEFELSMSGGFVIYDTCTFTIGDGFSDDFENGDNQWHYSGPSSWHITDHKGYSSQRSMYCGQEGSWEYAAPVINSYVLTDSIILNDQSELTFWHWYDIADQYDKVQIKMTTDGGNNWELLNPDQGYTGKWGYSPYDSCYTGQQLSWQQQTVDLNYDGFAQIAWLFFSSPSGVAEGYYFDDVFINVESGFVGIEEEQNGLPSVNTYQFRLSPAYPNPMQGRAVIAYSVASEGPVSLKVYDLTGREITTLINQVQGPGNYRVEWDGRDSHGIMVSSGT
ncbi:MAG: C25 family cysteine peptidase, partial [bacterium]